MNLNETNKPVVKKTVVIYAGRFQPFHRGHYDAYNRLCSKFGSSNVYIGTSNDTSGEKSPFSFNEKKEIATTMFGVPSSHFIKVNNPYRPTEILKKFDGKTTQYIAAVGDKDADRLQGKYFKPYKGKEGYGYDEIGYTYPIPAEKNPISGTDVRKGIGSSDNEKAKKFFLKAYPKYNRSIFTMIKKKLAEGVEMFEEDGMPGGIGTGLVLPGGYINGAPTGSQHEDYNSIQQFVHDTISETELNEFLNNYFNSISEDTTELVIGEDPNAALDTDITYTNSKGQKKKITARNALRLPKDHPAHIQAARIVGPDDAPANQPKKKEQPGVVTPAKQPQPPQPGQPVPKAQTVQAKADAAPKPGGSLPTAGGETPEVPNPQKLSGVELKSSAEKNLEKEKQTTDKEVADDAELKKLMPGIDTSKKTLDQVTPIERQKVATKIDDLVKMTQDAKEKGEKPKYYNLCQVSVPGTNLYCDGNLGIDRNDMPQFKGTARPGSPADKLPKDPKSGEVDTEQFFKQMLEKKGIKVAEPQAVPADRLKATQMNLVGDKVAGMTQGLEQNPQDPNLTAPIYVSNDGYVLDGHHRWAAIVGYNAKHPDKQIPMNVRVIDQPIKPLVKMSNEFADHMGIEKKAAVAGQGTPKSEPAKK
jgi:cytidyltransferase-like protein